MCTGIPSRPAALIAVAALLLTSGSSRAQSIKLVSLSLPPDVAAGSWVSYQVSVLSRNRAPRRFTQRLAIVSREGSGAEAGAWVELKTSESGKTRIERGFFMRPDAGKEFADPGFGADAPNPGAPSAEGPSVGASGAVASGGDAAPRLRLARYQRLTADGKLYEYSIDDEGAPLADEDVSAMDLFEFGGKVEMDSLAPDTLRIGRKVVPCHVRRIRRYGDQNWEGDDTTYVNRAVMARTIWTNPWIPVTGYARSVIEVSPERVSIRAAAPPDSAAASPPAATPAGTDASPGAAAGAGTAPSAGATPVAASAGASFYRAEVTLTDLGNDAVPEITQAPEPAPQEAAPRPKTIIK